MSFKFLFETKILKLIVQTRSFYCSNATIFYTAVLNSCENCEEMRRVPYWEFGHENTK